MKLRRRHSRLDLGLRLGNGNHGVAHVLLGLVYLALQINPVLALLKEGALRRQPEPDGCG